jgi:hypothetical protein
LVPLISLLLLQQLIDQTCFLNYLLDMVNILWDIRLQFQVILFHIGQIKKWEYNKYRWLYF